MDQQSADTACPTTGQVATFKLIQLPIDLVFYVFSEFVKSSGTIPQDTEERGYHDDSSLINDTLRQEEKLTLPLLRVSKLFCRITLGYMLGPSASILGFKGLEVQYKRRNMFPGIPSHFSYRATRKDARTSPNGAPANRPELPFLNLVQTLIIGPQPQRGTITQDFDFGAEPPTRLMKAILGALGEDPRLRKLIISGDALNPMEEETVEFEELETIRSQKLAEDRWAQYQSRIPHYLC
ncbi:hypothetical protein P167DRAFT_549399 [Morchella conica CCBAS932]|uniref:Uncharacterized protein n=1 Tax=Morchella conica CCBAS932 TaxID=1392247 RepID=A0A3N4KBI5_9PEZI|nr:hypothetical protein P167DRAFT_549399 [Morchella conica CCBAS932]